MEYERLDKFTADSGRSRRRRRLDRRLRYLPIVVPAALALLVACDGQLHVAERNDTETHRGAIELTRPPPLHQLRAVDRDTLFAEVEIDVGETSESVTASREGASDVWVAALTVPTGTPFVLRVNWYDTTDQARLDLTTSSRSFGGFDSPGETTVTIDFGDFDSEAFDADSDSRSNLQERLDGTDPFDPSSPGSSVQEDDTDADGDGVIDRVDQCPSTPATDMRVCAALEPVNPPADCAGFGGALQPPFDAVLECIDFGNLPAVPPRWGGLYIDPADPDRLFVGGAANGASGRLYRVSLARDERCNIVGYSSADVEDVAEAAFNDGGIAAGPGGVRFLSRWPSNELGQQLPDATETSRVIELGPLGIVSSPGGLAFVPDGFPGAGSLKIASWPGGNFYTLTTSPAADGTLDVTRATEEAVLPGGPEGFAYVSGDNPAFESDSLIVSEFSANVVSTFEIDASGNPITSTRREMLTGLSGAEGAAIDPLTGDYLFSTFGGGNRFVAVRGFSRPGCP